MRYLLILLTILLYSPVARADDTNTQTNTSGSNTNITGGYDSESTTNYNSGSSNTTTTNNDTNSTTNNNSTVPPPSANSPSYSSMSQDVCSMGVSGSVSTGLVGISGGKHIVDENCERIKLAKVLQDFGIEPEEFNENFLLQYVKDRVEQFDSHPTTEGIFAPWAFYKKDFQEIGGHDPLYAPQSKEDSDIFNRFQLNGIKFKQT